MSDHAKGGSLSRDEYLAFLRADAHALAAAARPDLTRAVPSCPGWSVADLVVHTGAVHRAQANIVATRAQEPLGIKREMFDSVAGLLGWLEGSALMGGTSDLRAIPPGLNDWFEEGAELLVDALAAADPDEPVWSWSETKRVAHYLRMMPIETAVHRWDAQLAGGETAPIARALAVDGVSQSFEVMMPMRRAHASAPPGRGERYRFRQTDGPGVWTVIFEGEPRMTRDDIGPAGVTAAGTASDLLLFLWQRLDPSALQVEGDAALLPHYFELVPPL